MMTRYLRFQLLSFSLAAALLAMPAWGKESGETVLVCGMLTGLEGPDVVRGRAVADQILRQAGIKLDWRNGVKPCATSGRGLVISASTSIPAGTSPGAMASASVYEGTHVEVFVNRLRKTFRQDQLAAVLGHVLAHEIIHMLQGIDRHSQTGLMKAAWLSQDYDEMARKPMTVDEEDLYLIRHGNFGQKGLWAGTNSARTE